ALSGVQKAFAALLAEGPVRAPVVNALEGVAAGARRLATTAHGPLRAVDPSLRAALASVSAAGLQPESFDWQTLLQGPLTTPLTELIATLEDCQILAATLKNPDIRLPLHLERESALPDRGILYRDRGLAFLSACAAVGGTLIACVLWIEGSWPEGGVAAQFAAIGASL